MRPRQEEIRCPCGRTFLRVNWSRGPGNSFIKHRGRSVFYCESCREERARGRKYGIALQEVEG
jgi:hypothetical protein